MRSLLDCVENHNDSFGPGSSFVLNKTKHMSAEKSQERSRSPFSQLNMGVRQQITKDSLLGALIDDKSSAQVLLLDSSCVEHNNEDCSDPRHHTSRRYRFLPKGVSKPQRTPDVRYKFVDRPSKLELIEP